jgi:N-acyl-D-aspartate/D-glutamate deacylase
MFDLVLRGGSVIDGTGGPVVSADIGITDGRLTVIGSADAEARETKDVSGLLIAPGFVDPHTHYDAQLHWDPYATPSSWHGVTSVIGGNCGFTLAPLRSQDADFTRRMMAQVEGMPLAALEEGLGWGWESFGEFLGALDGRIAVNAGFLVGHCALRRYVMGADASQRSSTPEELLELEDLLSRSLQQGGLGFSTSLSSTHNDADGRPVPSRLAGEDEVLALCSVTGQHEGTCLEAIVEGCLGEFSEAEIELLAAMSARAGRSLNWNVLSLQAEEASRAQHQLQPSHRARELGGRVVALSMPVFSENNMSFLTFCALWLLPGWREILDVPVEQKMRSLMDPSVRAQMLARAQGSETLSQLVEFERYLIGGDVLSEANADTRGRLVGDIANERRQDPFTCLAEIVVNDELETVLWPQPKADSAEDWALRRSLWEEPDVLLGGSDAGAHLDRLCGSAYPTRFLADCIRGRSLVSLERAVNLMTDVPARLFGLRERGRIAPNYWADLVVFDPETVGAHPARVVHDLPGGSKRLLADPIGVRSVYVNGIETISDGVVLGPTPGTVLRSGRDTETVATR